MKTLPVYAVSAVVLAMMAAPAALAQSLPPAGTPERPSPVRPSAPSATAPTAAATLPNTFDQGAPKPAAPSRGPQAASSGTEAAAEVADPAKVAAAETMLKRTVAAMQTGTPNYSDMSPDLGAKVRAQATTVTPVVQGFGALQSVKHVGHQNGAELFDVIFAQQATQWVIGLGEDGKIVVLLFRPAQ